MAEHLPRNNRWGHMVRTNDERWLSLDPSHGCAARDLQVARRSGHRHRRARQFGWLTPPFRSRRQSTIHGGMRALAAWRRASGSWRTVNATVIAASSRSGKRKRLTSRRRRNRMMDGSTGAALASGRPNPQICGSGGPLGFVDLVSEPLELSLLVKAPVYMEQHGTARRKFATIDTEPSSGRQTARSETMRIGRGGETSLILGIHLIMTKRPQQ